MRVTRNNGAVLGLALYVSSARIIPHSKTDCLSICHKRPRMPEVPLPEFYPTCIVLVCYENVDWTTRCHTQLQSDPLCPFHTEWRLPGDRS